MVKIHEVCGVCECEYVSECVCVCVVYEAAERFYSSQTVVSVMCELGIEEKVVGPLHSVTGPEEKRVIIGNTFMTVADEVISDLQLEADSVYLAQGELHTQTLTQALTHSLTQGL